MKTKSLVLLVMFTVAVVLVAFFVSRDQGPATSGRAERLALPGLPLDQVQTLRLTLAGAEPILLHRHQERWLVANRFDYPADFARIAALVQLLTEMKVVQEIAAGPGQHARLELAPPDATTGAGCRIELLADGDRPLAELIAGKLHLKRGDTEETAGQEWPDGRYLLLGAGEAGRVVLVGETFELLGTSADDWLEHDFPAARELKLASLSQDGQEQWRLARDNNQDELTAATVPIGRELDQAQANAIGSGPGYLRFTTVVDPKLTDAELGLDQPAIFTAETFTGLRYLFHLGQEQDGQCVVRLEVTTVELPSPTIPEQASAEDQAQRMKAHQDQVEQAAQQSREEQARYGAWRYRFPAAMIKPMRTDPAALFKAPEPQPKASEPGRPTTKSGPG